MSARAETGPPPEVRAADPGRATERPAVTPPSTREANPPPATPVPRESAPAVPASTPPALPPLVRQPVPDEPPITPTVTSVEEPAVWPTIDERALARAFDGLRYQNVSFDRCTMNLSAATGEVECRGVTSYVPRIGGQYERTESRQWTFRVRKGAERWVITSVAAR